MAAGTSTKQQNSLYPDLEVASERIREANERVVEAGLTVTRAYLDGFEHYVNSLTQLERKVGAQSRVEAVSDLFDAYAKITEDVTSATVSVARELIAR